VNFEMLDDHELGLTVPCPEPPHGCGQPAGMVCRRIVDNEPLTNLAGHHRRLLNAGVVHAPLPASELRGGDWQ
jgi:hypothetical protein